MILIVDDDTFQAKSLEEILQQLNQRTKVCKTGAQVLEHLLQLEGSVNLVITDYEMPEMDGIQLL